MDACKGLGYTAVSYNLSLSISIAAPTQCRDELFRESPCAPSQTRNQSINQSIEKLLPPPSFSVSSHARQPSRRWAGWPLQVEAVAACNPAMEPESWGPGKGEPTTKTSPYLFCHRSHCRQHLVELILPRYLLFEHVVPAPSNSLSVTTTQTCNCV